MRGERRHGLGAALALALLLSAPAQGEELGAVREGLHGALPVPLLEPLFSQPELTFRGAPARGPAVYRERVNGVVLIASTRAIGTGVVVSAQGDIVTNEHVVRDAHRAQGAEWIAVWFKPPNGTRPAKEHFVLGRVLRRNERRDLAHVRVVPTLPPTAVAIPLASMPPTVGQDVFAIGHPKTFLWSYTQGVVSQIRPDYQWRYEDGVPRTATAIQTRAAVGPGNSGGPLLDDTGSVVGIVVGAAAGMPGAYFAVSVQHVRELLPE